LPTTPTVAVLCKFFLKFLIPFEKKLFYTF